MVRFSASRVLVGVSLVCAVAVAAAGCHGQTSKVADKPASPIKSYYIKYKLQNIQHDGRVDVDYWEVWYKQPDRFRSQMGLDKNGIISIVNPKERIMWMHNAQDSVNEARDAATVVPIAAFDKPPMPEGVEIRPMSNEELLKQSGSGGKLAGKETVLGRVCDVVKSATTDGWKSTVCVDRETEMQLKLSNRLGGKPDTEVTAIEFKVNEPISDDVFNYKIPAGTFVIKGPIGSPVEYGLQDSWSQSAIDARLHALIKLKKVKADTLYRPTYIPKGYSIHGPPGGGTNADNPKGAISISYVNRKTGDAVVYTQSISDKNLKGSQFAKDGFSGTKVSGKEPYPYVILMWRTGESSFTLFTSNMSESEMIKIAKSVKPVE